MVSVAEHKVLAVQMLLCFIIALVWDYNARHSCNVGVTLNVLDLFFLFLAESHKLEERGHHEGGNHLGLAA